PCSSGAPTATKRTSTPTGTPAHAASTAPRSSESRSRAQLFDKVRELSRFVGREHGEQILLGVPLNPDALLVRLAAGVGDRGDPRSAIARIGRPADEAIGFQTTDVLRYVCYQSSETG